MSSRTDQRRQHRGAPRISSRLLCALLTAGLILVALGSLRMGSSGTYPLADCLRGSLAAFGWAEPLEGARQAIVELRFFRVLVSIGVGACLALSGALLQGVFRNDLASPGLLGVSAGANLGASLAILTLGGYGPLFMLERMAGAAPVFVSAGAFIGAIAVTAFVTLLASTGGRISVPTLLLVGIATNAVIGGLLAAIQSFVLQDLEIGRAIFAWGFGTLDDRSPYHVGLIMAGLLVVALPLPFIARELDLFATGEEDARSLGVETGRVKALALVAAALAASVAVSVAGQITFVGLVVPHILRLIAGRSHHGLLPACLIGGPLFLLGCDFAQRTVLGEAYLQPGVLMSVIGGPFFLALLVIKRKRIQAW